MFIRHGYMFFLCTFCPDKSNLIEMHFPAPLDDTSDPRGITMHFKSWLNNILCLFCASILDIVLGFHGFPSPSYGPPFTRLVFPPTLPIILDVITHCNVTHKGKQLLCLTDLGPTLPSACWERKRLESLTCRYFQTTHNWDNHYAKWHRLTTSPVNNHKLFDVI